MDAKRYKWFVVVLLWGVCLLNYADRQAIFSVFPVLKTEFKLSNVQLGIIGGAFMWLYAAALPLAGIITDRLPRKHVIIGGLVFWSAITLATGWAASYRQLVFFRALEGLGEAFYFPASMSLISAYHSPSTRSRAMALHQSSVYIGTIAGGTAAGYLADQFGWRIGFYLFGSLGIAFGLVLLTMLREPGASAAAGESALDNNDPDPAPTTGAATTERLPAVLADIFRRPMVLVLIAVFVGANFVAAIFLTWMPSFLNRKFSMSLTMSGFNATAWLQLASVLGVITGGVFADKLARHYRSGRMLTQALGLFAGVPFIFFTGWTLSVPFLVSSMAGFGFFKGLYDANIWASLFDVVRRKHRATALGFMNAIGWLGAGGAPVLIGAASEQFGMSACLSATSVIYLVFGLVLTAGIAIFMRK